jgi:phage shock protein C
MSEGRALMRPREDRVIAGVCSGLADYLGWSARRVRIAYVLLSIVSAAFPGIAVYLVLWYLMPETGGGSRRRFSVNDPDDPFAGRS